MTIKKDASGGHPNNKNANYIDKMISEAHDVLAEKENKIAQITIPCAWFLEKCQFLMSDLQLALDKVDIFVDKSVVYIPTSLFSYLLYKITLNVNGIFKNGHSKCVDLLIDAGPAIFRCEKSYYRRVFRM